MGVTINCSMVPRSRSRTMEREVSIVVSRKRTIAIRPGIIKLTLFISGLYQTRGWTWTPGRSSAAVPNRRSISRRLWACPTDWEAEKTVLATLGSEPSMMKAMLVGRPATTSSP